MVPNTLAYATHHIRIGSVDKFLIYSIEVYLFRVSVLFNYSCLAQSLPSANYLFENTHMGSHVSHARIEELGNECATIHQYLLDTMLNQNKWFCFSLDHVKC